MAMREESSEGSVLLLGLPNDLGMQCLILVSRRFHEAMRCVCRAWHPLLDLPSFYDMRLTQGLAEEWLYVMLRTDSDEYGWLSLEEGGDGFKRWRPLPPMPMYSVGAAYAFLGSKIYLIGGSHGGSASRIVCTYDSCTNRWEMAALLQVPR
ncbi:hypothetical protein O6H91_01G123500 [Diphasiastrum complanatum]|uniref:Uncharacterized protein n=1 Tax=Diphasiastrum complanatum TaxID=34168 RepID=A0ACC2EVM0_DIPCM|nr:hypothetical protein O6H91_01G123500 [Diphasiastrum complanatum]